MSFNSNFSVRVLITTIVYCVVYSTHAADIYVAKNGHASNDGTLNSPFLNISTAANIARPGDTVHIREGLYHETLRPKYSGIKNAPITFKAYKDEKVVITAMEYVNNWKKESNKIYVADTGWSLQQQNLVMQNTTAMDLARWPNNTDGDLFTQNTLRNTGGSKPEDTKVGFLDYQKGIPKGDWSKGGSIHFYGDKPGSGWIAWRAFITGNTDKRVTFDLNKSVSWIIEYHAPIDRGDFFLQGIREVLDYQNEWYLDEESKQLYVMLPKGKKPAKNQIQLRKRLKTIDLENRNYIHIKNLAVFGGSIEITGGASYNYLYEVKSFHGNTTLGVVPEYTVNSQSVNIRSDKFKHNTIGNIIEKSEIAFGSGTGVYDSGNGTQILNSYIHDFNTIGSYDSAIHARGGKNTKIIGNTITRAGRDTIQGFNRNAEYAYNDVSFSNLIADDCGLFYTVGGPFNSEIHHNWFHDAYSSGNKSKATGIYLDNSAEGFDVHHNVVWNTEWTNIQINWNGKDLNIYNNTLLKGSEVMGAWHKEGTSFSNVNVWNNLSDNDAWEPQSDKQNNLVVGEDAFVDSDAFDFRLQKSSAAKDKGRHIDKITTNVKDNKPDVGAYEIGSSNENWRAGIDWNPKVAALGIGCYQLAGEVCHE